MKRTLFFLLLHSCSLVLWSQSGEPASGEKPANNLKYVDPLIGNIGQLLVPTRPTVHLPNQVIRMYPDRDDYTDDQIRSFPLTIVSHRLGQVFSVKPSGKVKDATAWNELLTYDHDLEITRPWYYSTWLIDQDIKVEFTPATKTGIYRFTFPAGKEKSLLFGMYNRGTSSYKLESGNKLSGVETYHGNIKVYLYGMFTVAGEMQALVNRELSSKNLAEGQGVKAAISFPTSSSNTIEFRYAISYISPGQALKNFNKEIANVSFDAVSKKAEQSWS